MSLNAIPPNQTIYITNLNDKVKKIELKESLYYLFSQHGKILDIVALKTPKTRGQAFIVFDQISGATSAMRSLQGFPFYDKNMKISYAKSKSNAIKLRDGTFFTEKSSALKRSFDQVEDISRDTSKRFRENEEEMEEDQDDDDLANMTLFVTQLPDSVTEEALITLFQQYPGFKEVRMVPGKSDIAFVDYETPIQADGAKRVLNGFEISPGVKMGVEFAKK